MAKQSSLQSRVLKDEEMNSTGLKALALSQKLTVECSRTLSRICTGQMGAPQLARELAGASGDLKWTFQSRFTAAAVPAPAQGRGFAMAQSLKG